MHGMTENMTAVQPVPFTLVHLLKTKFQDVPTEGHDLSSGVGGGTAVRASPLGSEMIFYT